MTASWTAFVLAVLLLAVPTTTTTAHEQYSTLGDLLHWYAHSAQTHPSVVRYTELREPGYEHAILPLATFTNYGAEEARGRNKSSVMLVFGEHARELITCEVGLWFSRVLLGDTAEIFSWAEWREAFKPLGISPDRIPATVQGWVRRILDNLLVKVLPVENVDGRQAWEAGNLCLRKTSKGVDLNRNYPFAFATEPPHSEMYGGPQPFSEAQSRLVARLALEGGSVPKAYINVHSGEWAVYSGWDSKAAVGPGLPADLSDLLIRSGDVCRCQAGPAGAVSNYLAYGTGMDFMYTQLGVPYALTYEVYGSAGPFGNGEPGRLPDGARNKPLSDYPCVTDDRIARAVPRIDDLFGPHQHQHQHQHHRHQQHQRARDAAAHNHLNRQQRRARANAAARLRRSAVARADEQWDEMPRVMAGAGGGGGGGGGWQRARAGGFGRGQDPAAAAAAAAVAPAKGTTLPDEGRGGGGGRTLLDASDASSSVSSAAAASAATAALPLGPLGGRSMRRLAAAAAAAGQANDGSPVAAAEAQAGISRGAQALEGGAAALSQGAEGLGRALKADLSGSTGSEGPILAMVRSQPGMHQSCFDMFNPPPGAPYRDVVARWVVVLLMTLDHVADPAHPQPSPHPLPGTVLAGAGVSGSGAAAAGATAFGRRRLMEASASASVEALETEEQAAAGTGGKQAEAGHAAGGGGEAAAAAAAADREGGGSAAFDRRVQQQQQQQLAYEVDPVLRQRSLVVLVAIVAMVAVFVPWFMCAANTVSRPLPPGTVRRARQQQVQQLQMQLLQQQAQTRAYNI